MKSFQMKKTIFLVFAFAVTIAACVTKTEDTPTVATPDANLNLKFKFDPAQVRLGNLGQAVSVVSPNSAQTPTFRTMAVHYIQLAPDSLTALTDPTTVVLYSSATTTAGGTAAIDFDQLKVSDQNKVFLSYPLKNIKKGTYKWIRVSAAYQNYDIKFNIRGLNPAYGIPNNALLNQTGSIASFIGIESFIRNYTIATKSIAVNANKKQGYGGMETNLTGLPAGTPDNLVHQTFTWDGNGGTTVVNPFATALGVPPGSCLIVGKLNKPLVITGDEAKDISTILSFSCNNSFEWTNYDGNTTFDFYNDGSKPNDKVVDMGLRGLKVIVE